MKEMILVHRETGAAAIPLRYPDVSLAVFDVEYGGDWYLLTLCGLGPRSPWARGIRTVRKAVNADELPPLS